MRVLFLTLYPDVAASPRYRVGQYVPYLRAHGVDCTVACPLTAEELEVLTGPNRQRRPFWYHARETLRRVAQILGASRYDVVFLQKTIMSAYVRGLAELVRSRARRLVYDIDDAVHLAPPHPLGAPWRLMEDRSQILKLMASADLVLAGNAWLLSEARQAGSRWAMLFPTVVDTDRFVPACSEPPVYRIGWVGNPSTTVCLQPAAEALGSPRHATVRLIGADPNRVPFRGAELRPWSLEREVAELQDLSVGVMPQLESAWMRGKCALKALQYMACGIPCVATPFGAALEFMRHDENGLFAESTTGWLRAFEKLRDAGVRRRLGEGGRATVEAGYALRDATPRLLELLRAVA